MEGSSRDIRLSLQKLKRKREDSCFFLEDDEDVGRSKNRRSDLECFGASFFREFVIEEADDIGLADVVAASNGMDPMESIRWKVICLATLGFWQPGDGLRIAAFGTNFRGSRFLVLVGSGESARIVDDEQGVRGDESSVAWVGN